MPGPQWLDGYSGQNVDELIALASEHRIDSIVLAFEQALQQTTGRQLGEPIDERLFAYIRANRGSIRLQK